MEGNITSKSLNIAYIGNFQFPHCTEVHIGKTLEDLGHKVTRLQENNLRPNWVNTIPKDTDLLLYTRTWGTYVSLNDLKTLKERNIPTASYHLDLYVGIKREDGLDNDPFWRTDYVFTPDGDYRSQKVFKDKGINHFYIKPGVFKDECIKGVYTPRFDSDVAFVGGGSGYAHKEWPYRAELVNWLYNIYGEKYNKYGHPEETVRNQDLNNLYASAKVIVGDSLCTNFDHEYYWSDRVYETIGRGGFIIHPYIKGMEEEFTDKENIVFYEYKNFNQLKELIDHYIENPQERNTIRDNGQNFVRENATYHNRLQQALNIIFSEDTRSTQSNITTKDDNILTDGIKINLGSGNDPKEGYINVDIVDLPSVDRVHNLIHFPYPFEDNSATSIRAVDVVEHLPNYIGDKNGVITFIEECHRILKPGGELFIQTPRYDAEFLWIDISHIRGFHENSFDFFDPTTHYGQTTGFYSKCKFKVRHEILENKNLRFYMEKIV